MTSDATSWIRNPVGACVSRRRVRWCSVAWSPTWAALMRSAASLDTTVVGPSRRWPSAAARMRLSALVGSRPRRLTSSRWRPLVSMWTVPPSGSATGVRMSPSLWTRSRSIVRITSRAARPTSSIRDLCWSSSSITTSGMTAASPTNANSASGSATSTEVSSTTRVVAVSADVSRSFGVSRSVTGSPLGRRRPAGAGRCGESGSCAAARRAEVDAWRPPSGFPNPRTHPGRSLQDLPG